MLVNGKESIGVGGLAQNSRLGLVFERNAREALNRQQLLFGLGRVF